VAVRKRQIALDGRSFYIQDSGAHRIRESILAARILMVLNASIIFTLGVIHLIYTFGGGQSSRPVTPRCKSA
jgi:hypothetical protein